MKVITALTGAAVALAAIPLTMQRVDLNRLLEANRALYGQAAQAQALQTENEELSRLELDVAELERLRGEHVELLRLRGEIGMLRADWHSPDTRVGSRQSILETAVPAQPLLETREVRVQNCGVLVMGTRRTLSGEQSVLTVTPMIIGSRLDSAEVIRVLIRLYEGSRSGLAELGLGDFWSENPVDQIQRCLTVREGIHLERTFQNLLQMERTPGGEPRFDEVHCRSATISALDGHQTKVSLSGQSVADGAANETIICLIPKIVTDSEIPIVEVSLSVQQAPAQPANSGAGVPTALAAPK